jgi:hypothetical protein
MSEDVQPPSEAADVQTEAAVPEVEQPTPIEVTAVEKPKPKRYVKKKVAPPEPPTPTPEEPVTPPEPPTAETPIPKAKPKAKPRAKKAVSKDVVKDTEDEEPIAQEVQEPTIVTEPEVVVEADTTPDTRTPQQRLSDMQLQMKKLRKEAKQVNYKRMLEGKIYKESQQYIYSHHELHTRNRIQDDPSRGTFRGSREKLQQDTPLETNFREGLQAPEHGVSDAPTSQAATRQHSPQTEFP